MLAKTVSKEPAPERPDKHRHQQSALFLCQKVKANPLREKSIHLPQIVRCAVVGGVL